MDAEPDTERQRGEAGVRDGRLGSPRGGASGGYDVGRLEEGPTHAPGEVAGRPVVVEGGVRDVERRSRLPAHTGPRGVGPVVPLGVGAVGRPGQARRRR